jgi:hypothetical protein
VWLHFPKGQGEVYRFPDFDCSEALDQRYSIICIQLRWVMRFQHLAHCI